MRPVLITVFDSETGTTSEYSFTTSPVRIGRNNLNDLTLPFPFVSGWHAVVRFEDDSAKFFDLGSTNGTLLNGKRVQAGEPVVIAGELSLTIGKLELRIRREGDQPAWGTSAGGTMPAHMPPGGAYGGPVAPAPIGGQPKLPTAVGTIDPDRPPAPPPKPEGTAHVEMSDVHQLVSRLRPLYSAYRESWTGLAAELENAIAAMPTSLQPFGLSIVSREFPEVASEPEFGKLAQNVGVPMTVATTGSAGSGAELQAVGQLAKSLRPQEEPPRSPQEAQRFLSCVEDVLRASAKAVVELQRGQEQFGNEMGVRTIKEFTALHAAGTPENVLTYLLDWQKGGPHRTQELVGMYADLMIHQVALINGVMAGVRSLLAQMSPEAIERQVKSGWPTRAAALWKQYGDVFAERCEEDKKVTAAVFGADFARAYAEVGGEQG